MDAKDDMSQCSLATESEVTAEIILCIVEPTRPCDEPVCLPIPDDKLTDDDGATCWFTGDIIPHPCMWACNGTCFATDLVTFTESGGAYISTQPSDTELEIELYVKHFS